MTYTSDDLTQLVAEELGFDDSLDLLSTCVADSIVPSICTECGTVGDMCEPDARNYTCEECGKSTRSSIVEIALF